MGLRINSNLQALNAQRAITGTKKNMDSVMTKLSSGYRINRAADDAAGLAISENMRAQMRGMKQANRNAQDGISFIQTAEGGMTEVANILIRLRELGVQAASDTISDRERNLLDLEYGQLLDEVDRIALSTEFNGTRILTGEGDRIDFQVSTRNNEFTDRISFDPIDVDSTTAALGIDLATVYNKESARQSLANIDEAINHVNAVRADLGAIQNRLNSTIENIQSSVENIATANSRIRDTDMAEETSELAKQNVLMQAGVSVLTQANQGNNMALQLLQKG
jgi:flagellin